MGERAPHTLAVTQANRDAAALLTGWRVWPGGALALIGPPGSGKTHLALAWALEAGARALRADAPPSEAADAFAAAEGRLLLEDCDRGFDQAGLWRVLDLARAEGGAVLLTAAARPSDWPAGSPDLRSRLAALPVARLGEPDEALMELVLRRICREQFIQLSEDATKYLARRLPRSFAAVHALAAALDETIVKGARRVSVAAAKRALERAQAGWSFDTEAE
jgi:chromosomal replication initiation ATPase DnaA